jgi:hypothetical protein
VHFLSRLPPAAFRSAHIPARTGPGHRLAWQISRYRGGPHRGSPFRAGRWSTGQLLRQTLFLTPSYVVSQALQQSSPMSFVIHEEVDE